MDKSVFEAWTVAHHGELEEIRREAHRLHESVNQHYDHDLPYSLHLDMVAQAVARFAHAICQHEDDIMPIFFGAWFHDSIEDARQTYNDVRRTALRFMNEAQASVATEIVYALTNEKGRTRAERANDRYYAGIRQTPYAPLVKMADRLANMTYSCHGTNDANRRMLRVYTEELPHFIESLRSPTSDPRMQLPPEMVDKTERLLQQS